MNFTNDIFSLNKPTQVKFDLTEIKLPNSNDVYFRAKQTELLEQYQAARIFIEETETDDWEHWFDAHDEQKLNEAFRLIFKSHFYEAALFFYNAVVDISWTLCYVAIEYACRRQGKRVNISGMKPIEEAVELLREAEKNVTNPSDMENPFSYLKRMCPEFETVINSIVDFWNAFSEKEIRKRYNFCKHKGKPAYEEIERLRHGSPVGFYIKDTSSGQFTQIATNTQDVRYSFSLEEAIAELRNFDDNELFPYIEKLIKSIEEILQPSPIVF